jgi:hypothetical protein
MPEITNTVPAASSNVERKTTSSQSDSTPPTVIRSGLKNVLNDYRSFTYNFTLSALKRMGVSDPKSFSDSEKNLMILKSGGKGTSGLRSAGLLTDEQLAQNRALSTDRAATVGSIARSNKNIKSMVDNDSAVNEFNQKSPGRFDMFIDDVAIDTLMAFDPKSNITLPTKIEFTVMEPYSINGFIEAIHYAAVAAGYDTYVGASFLLKVDFIGYKDTETIDAAAEWIPNSSRYFPFIFTGLEVTLTEKGTTYRCSAVPFNEKGFGQPNNIKQPISAVGNNVFEVLNSLMSGVNSQVAEFNNAAKTPEAAAAGQDEYFVEFKSWDSSTNKLINDSEGVIPKSKLDGFYSSKSLFKFPDPGTKQQPDAYKDNKDQPTTQQQAEKPQLIKYEPVNQKPGVQFAEGAAIHECISVIVRDSDYVRNILQKISSNDDHIIDANTGLLDYFIVTMQVEYSDKTDNETRMPFKKFTYVVSPYKIHYTQIPGYKASVINADKIKAVSLRQYSYTYTGQNVDVLNFKLNFNTLFFEAIPAAMGNNSSPSARNSAGRVTSNQSNISAANPKVIEAEPNGTPGIYQDASPGAIKQDGGTGGQKQDSPYSVLAINMHDAIVNSKASMLTGTIDILGDPFYLITGGVGNFEPDGHDSVPGMTKDGSAANNYGIVLIDINFRTPIDINSFEQGGMLSFKEVPFSGVYMVTQARSKFKDGMFKQELEIIRMPGQLSSSAIPPTDPAIIQPSKEDPTENPVPVFDETTQLSVRADAATLDTISRGVVNNASNFTNSPGGFGTGNLSNTSGLNSAIINDIMNVSIGGVNPLTTGIRISGLTAVSNTLGSAAVVNQAANTLATTLPLSVNSAVSQLTNTVNSKLPVVDSISQSAQAVVSGLGSSAASLVNGIGTKLDALSGNNSFGIDSSKITGVAGLSGMTSKIFGSLNALKSNLPAGIESAASQGIIINPVKMSNLPAIPPASTAPDAEADTYASQTVSASQNLIQSAGSFLTNATAVGGKLLSATAQVSSLIKVAQSPEALLNSVDAASNPVNFGLSKSATDLFGSKTNSPLANLITKSNVE